MRRAIFLCTWLGLLSGCLLSPRDPDPITSVEVCFDSFPSREFQLVFQNLDGAYDCLQQSTVDDQLGEEFVFIPAPSVAASFPEVFDEPWDLVREQSWLAALFAGTDTLRTRLRVTDINPPSGSFASGPLVVEASYTVRHVPRGGTAIVYRGEAFYTLRVVATNWVMTRWEEKESAVGDLPLGNLRGGLAQ
jgi:hypothetical protein